MHEVKDLKMSMILDVNCLDMNRLYRSAELGYAFAQAVIASVVGGAEKLRWAGKAVAQGERNGFYWLGVWLLNGIECEKNDAKAKQSFLMAAEQGAVLSMSYCGWLLDESDPRRYFWLGLAAANGDCRFFLEEMQKQIELFYYFFSGRTEVVFAIGKALKGHIDDEKQTMFGSACDYDSLITLAKQALQFYESQLMACRRGVNAWSMIAKRLGVIKDVRLLISKLIWNAREEAKYFIEDS
jgi:hypothetical protein